MLKLLLAHYWIQYRILKSWFTKSIYIFMATIGSGLQKDILQKNSINRYIDIQTKNTSTNKWKQSWNALHMRLTYSLFVDWEYVFRPIANNGRTLIFDCNSNQMLRSWIQRILKIDNDQIYYTLMYIDECICPGLYYVITEARLLLFNFEQN